MGGGRIGAMWCDYGGEVAEGLVATKRKNDGTKEEK